MGKTESVIPASTEAPIRPERNGDAGGVRHELRLLLTTGAWRSTGVGGRPWDVSTTLAALERVGVPGCLSLP